MEEKPDTRKPKTMHAGHRQRVRKRFQEHGLGSFADHEALEFYLYHVLPRRDTNPLAHRLLEAFGGHLSALAEADAEKLAAAGAGQKAAEFMGLIPLFQQAYHRDKTDCGMGMKNLSSAQQAARFAERLFAGSSGDRVYLCCMDAKMNVRRCVPLLDGQLALPVDMRSIVQAAALVSSSHLLLMASHGDGQPAFFDGEIAAVQELSDALKKLSIRLFDMILYTADGVISLCESGVRLKQ